MRVVSNRWILWNNKKDLVAISSSGLSAYTDEFKNHTKRSLIDCVTSKMDDA